VNKIDRSRNIASLVLQRREREKSMVKIMLMATHICGLAFSHLPRAQNE
jgi:hypothetical protein